MSKVQTENSHFKQKINLRINNIPKGDLTVLDCFSADGKIWDEIKKTNPKIKVLRIEKKNNKKGIYLNGNNEKYLSSFNYGMFDVIDLDAFGVPFNQLEIILDKAKPGTLLFITFIQTMFGALPKKMLNYLGYTDKMIKKIPSIFNKKGFGKFCNYMYIKGLRNIEYYDYKNKFYILTKIEGVAK